MAGPSTARPLGVRVLNGVGWALEAAGLPVLGLDPDRLLARAARRTRLDDFGDDAFREPYRILLDALEREARLTTLGRVIARADLGRLLENRLHMVAARAQHPEIT